MFKFDVQVINPFLESMANVLVTMATLKPKPGKVSLKTEDIAFGDVTGSIELKGDNFKASMAVTFTKPVILEITQRMLGEAVTEIDDTVADLVGEITNMVSGGAKNILSRKGYHIGMSIPAVVTGHHHKIIHKAKGPKIIVPFSVGSGDFFVEVCFESFGDES